MAILAALYARTRHNAGSGLVDELRCAARTGASCRGARHQASSAGETGRLDLSGSSPMQFMNRRAAARERRELLPIAPRKFLVAHDETDLLRRALCG
ncbi:MAG: hypothetical protein IPI06_15495 [Gammaproteobacteria bacterium]|nr:hypothetical protein [Gammaproteobacteria bacterium]